MPDLVERSCPAKVNLFLRILARETSGYHQLETHYLPISLHDSLTIERSAAGISLDVIGADLGPVEENLAWRAADAILEATGRRFGVSLKLTKRIPAGGGLGGGSSDAAAALLGVNSLADNRVPRAELLVLAARLGADVPFFVTEAPAALAWGRGQRMLRLAPPPARPALLLLPGFGVATATAYAWLDRLIDQRGPRGGIVLDPDHLSEWSTLARLGGNDFEAPVFGEYPRLRQAFLALAKTAPMLCRMSGSGSTLIAVYRQEADRAAARATLGETHGRLLEVEIGGHQRPPEGDNLVQTL